MKIKVSDYVMKFIENLGVKDVFCLSGGGNMHLINSLGESNLNPIFNLHEQASAICAEGYAQYTNNIGVCLVTTGPAGTNTITAVASAWIDSVPLLVISGQVKTSDLEFGKNLRQAGIQHVDITSIVKPITKSAITITDAKDIKFELERAVYLATTGRKGPVWLDIPLDIQNAEVEGELLSYPTYFLNYFMGDSIIDSQIEGLLKLLEKSKRPIILAGNGIRLSGALDIFKEVVDKLQIPILTTWKAMDYFGEYYKYYMGRPGLVGQRHANIAQQESDLIICIGARLDNGQVAFNYGNFAKDAKKVIIDIDSDEINKVNNFNLFFHCDVKDFLESLNSKIKIGFGKDIWWDRCNELSDDYPIYVEEQKGNENYISTYSVIEALSEFATQDDIIVPDSSGSASEITQQVWQVKRGQRIICSQGLGSMGFQLPQAIGVCIASGKKRVICIAGDGSIQMNIQELELLRRYKLPIKIFVISNNGYGSIRNTQDKFFDGNQVGCDGASGMTLPDLEKISYAYGIDHEAVYDEKKLRKMIHHVLGETGSCICEIVVDPNQQTLPKVQSQMIFGEMVSGTMEDMYPYENK